MDLEIVNKLFLELSQFATAKTARELRLEKRRDGAVKEAAYVLQRLEHGIADLLAPVLRAIIQTNLGGPAGDPNSINYETVAMAVLALRAIGLGADEDTLESIRLASADWKEDFMVIAQDHISYQKKEGR